MAENIGGLASMAGAGNPGVANAFQDVMDKYKVPLPPSQEERAGALNAYTDAIKKPADDRSGFDVLMQGTLMSDNPANAPQVMGNAFKYKMMWDQTQREAVKKGAEMAAKAQYDDMVKRQGEFDKEFLPVIKGQMGVAGNRGVAFRYLKDEATGQHIVVDNRTGTPVGMLGGKDISAIQTTARQYAADAVKNGEYATLNEAMEWARQTATAEYFGIQQAVNPKLPSMDRAKAAPQGGVSLTRSAPAPAPAPTEMPEQLSGPGMKAPPEPAPRAPAVGLDFDGVNASADQLPPAAQEEVSRLVNRLQNNPSPELHAATVKRMKELAQQYGGAAPVMPKLDSQTQREKEGYGSQTGKHMADTAIDLQKTGAAASSLIGDLTTLERLYEKHGENIPEGALAPWISSIKSGAKSLGIEVTGQGPTDVINAIATKQAMQSRTADGQNLLPGAMSNYEDRLLQSTAPGLAQTHEGRMLLIQIMKVQMGMKRDLAEAARDYVAKNRRLDEGWFSVAAERAKQNPFLDPKRLDAIEAYATRLAAKKGEK